MSRLSKRLYVLAALAVIPLSLGSSPSGVNAAPAPTASSAPSVADELIVTYRGGAQSHERSAARDSAQATLARRLVAGRSGVGEVELVRVAAGADRAAAMARLAASPHVVAAEPNWIVTTADTSDDPQYTSGKMWGMYGNTTTPSNQYGSEAGEAWAVNHIGLASVHVCVIDEGIQVSHPDLDANIWVNPFDAVGGGDNDGNGYVDDVNGWDWVNDNSSVYDSTADDHATHVAGTIGAEGGNATGVVGVNWEVTMISLKFLGPTGGTTADAILAIDYCTDLKIRHGLDIVASNNSWGGGAFSTALRDAIVRGANADILFIAAAGNGGTDGVGDNNDVTPHYPSNYTTTGTGGSTYEAVISVAAITKRGAKAGFSNYGLTSVDIGAPGEKIMSTVPFNRYNGTYSGTSMATPHVTGGAALYRSTHLTATAADIRAAIIAAAIPTTSLSGKVSTGGRLSVSTF